MLQRVKEVQESDLRMDGALARNIQRVIAVTQADIDTAAAQGKGWLVKRVVKVNDPLDNLRGGTQLVIKQNSIQPGQNVMRVLYAGSGKTVGPAVAPLSLPGAAAEDIMSLIAFGGTIQNGVPSGYTPLEYITLTGTQYLDTGVSGYSNTNVLKIKINPSQITTTCFITFQNPSAGDSNLGLFLSSSRWNFQYGAAARLTALASANTDVSLEVTNGSMKVNGVSQTGTPVTEFTISENILIGAAKNNTTIDSRMFQGRVYYFRWEDSNGNVLFNGVPAKDSNNVVGMYDTISGRFLTNQGTGDIAAGPAITPTPAYPADIVCNNGVLKARHQSGLPLGYTLLDYIKSNGTQYIDLGTKGNGTTKAEVKFKYHTATSASGSGRVFGSRNAAAVDAFAIGSASGTASTNSTIAFFFGNQSYLVTDKSVVLDEWLDVIFDKTTHNINGTDYGDPYNDETFETPQNLKLFGFDNNGTMGYGQVDIARCKLWDNGVLIRDLVPCKNASNVVGMYDLANDQFYTNDGTGDFAAGTAVSDPVEIYADGLQETIAIKDDQSATVSTATCEDLLSVGTYTDEQEVISGVVTRNVGVKVLDGTEGWVQSDTKNDAYRLVLTDAKREQQAILSTHFIGTSAADANMPSNSIKVGSYAAIPNYGVIAIRLTDITTLADFKQFLAAQYANGTPVIVIYPLATATTESVTPQPMQTAAGDNTAEITQAGMAGLELQVEYIGV